MLQDNKILKTLESKNQGLEDEFTFKVILKFWKKESRNAKVTFTASQCENVDVFVKAVRNCFHIKSAHCLEEIWLLQELKECDKPLQWVKELNGRIKINIPESYKDFLLNKGLQLGNKEFEDPSYTIEQ